MSASVALLCAVQALGFGTDLAVPEVRSELQFVRRVSLDLTGRIPSTDLVRSYLSDPAPSAVKRTQLIDRLLDSPEFNDKWTMWAGDWLRNNAIGIYVNPVPTRNQFHRWIRESIAARRSLREMASAVLTASEDSGAAQTGGFLAATEVNTGPKEDSWDNMFAKAATQFLGLGHYDCLLCHSGAGHLDSVSLWGSRIERIEAQHMAAFFTDTFSYPGSTEDDPTGLHIYHTPGYSMDTTFGNRPIRTGGGVLLPAYRDGSAPMAGEDWRGFLASKITEDPMFAVNLANRLWKQVFGTALAEPVDALDPARLDPANPPPSPWMFQASDPALLQQLAQQLRDTDYDLRAFVRRLVTSPQYLSDRPVRKLDAEEIHDAVQTATGVTAAYAIPGMADPVEWAMQLPDTAEPSTDEAAQKFLDAFYRGNRADAGRVATPSLPQAFALLNNPVVLARVRVATSTVLARIAAIDTGDEDCVRELFLAFLTREPSERELSEAAASIQTADDRAQAIEDLAWTLINHPDFVFAN
jgi:hypothetical protein